MTQSKMESLFENVLNVVSGLLLSIYVVQPIVFKIYKIELSSFQNIQIAIIFTIVSIIRGYFWRRYFDKKLLKKLMG